MYKNIRSGGGGGGSANQAAGAAVQSPVDLIIKCQALKYLARISDTINNI